MSIATKITGNREFNLIELEDYATQPVRLMAVRRSELLAATRHTCSQPLGVVHIPL